ncbi:MAG: NAD(P)H-dependent oxidoreductase [Bacteroidota bacterium]
MSTKPTILTISGSLRPNSSNNAVIDIAIKLFSDKANFVRYEGIGSLPHFDDSKEPRQEVLAWREAIKNADGVLICSPEYAFGVPGSLKNALDWTVSTGELVYKPLALITAATGGDKAHAALLHTFTALSCRIPADGALLISFIRSKMSPQGEVTDSITVDEIRKVVEALISAIISGPPLG